MDWQGQKLAEELMQYMLVGSAVVAFITGYSMISFRLMLLIYGAGVILTVLTTVPNWPFYNRHGLKWLDPGVASAAASPPKSKQAEATKKPLRAAKRS